ncbi:MAG TPA: hypothetical protein VNF46_05780 [Gammaproteobacteria bacterium]|nr:hypothetical protein [Gammaproteobacteria bacterium]
MPQITSVATFVAPLNQFEKNETPDACVAYGAADIEFCGPPNGQPTGTAEQIDQLADKWYADLEGSYAASNTNGMSVEALYTMLDGLGLDYTALPPTVEAVRATLERLFWPILICGAERGFFDVALGKVPYGWDYSQYNHCIVVCGVTSSGNLLVRDYANLMAEPGSVREYDASKMLLVSATAVEPHWMKPLPVAPASTLLQPTPDDLHVWGLLHPDIVLDPAHGIPQSWLQGRWKHNCNFGPALEPEQNMTETYKSNHTIIEQEFARARASWHADTGKTTWYDARGVAIII